MSTPTPPDEGSPQQGQWQPASSGPPPPPTSGPPPPPPGGGPPPPSGGPPPGWGQPAPPSGPPPGWSQPAPPAYGYGYGTPAPQTDGTAITALVLSIASFVVCPLIPSVVALALVPSSKRKIDESRGAVTGEGLLTAAKIISWINIGLCALATVLIVILIIVGAAVDDSDEFSLVLSMLA